MCPSSEDPDFSLEASAEIRIANQVERDKDLIRTLERPFHQISNWGCRSFISWQSLISPEKGQSENKSKSMVNA